MSIKKNIFLKYPNKYFVETGCYEGDGLNFAVDAQYQKIISIELAEKYYKFCTEKFKNNENVNIVLGDSAVVMYDVIKNIDSKITFWLDGHFCGGDSGLGLHISPLIQELEHIKNHHIKEHTILIDDVRCWIKKDDCGWCDQDEVIKKIKEINPDYKIIYEEGIIDNDVLVAYI